MAIPTLIPTAATLSGSVAQDHPHHRVSLGLGTDEIAFGEDKFACQRMEPRPEADEPSPPKKVKREARTVETILKQTAEIGMVLVGMAALRGGAPPTPVECHLAVEAYTNLEGLVERVAPHDLVSQKSLQSLIQQFSLPQQPTSPLVSTPTPAQDVSTPTTGAVAAPASGKRSRIKVTPRSPKAAVRPRGRPPKNPVTRLRVSRSVSTSGAGESVGKGSKSPTRVRGSKTNQPPDEQRQVHQQIAFAIQLSKPEVFLAALPETASAYIDSPFKCDSCKVLLNETSSVLICDGCEAGFHLRCLKMYKHSDIPEKDWYCTKCVAVSGGRPKPSIYGPLRRGPGRRGSRTAWILKSISEHQSAKPSEYRLRLRNAGAAEDGENLNGVKASSAVHVAEDTRMESSPKTLET